MFVVLKIRHSPNSFFLNPRDVCLLFEEMLDEHECSNCISGKTTDMGECLICSQQEKECQLTDQNFIGGVTSKSEFGCYLECSLTEGCKHYNWYSLDHEEFQEICVLFSACDTLEPCSSGCVSGHVDCACNGDYMILDDPTRNVNYIG